MLKRIAHYVRSHDWFAVAIEVLVVVIGLLLAFELDDWREGWAERQQERSYVARLTTDLQTDVPAIEGAIALGRLRLQLADLLIRVAADPLAAAATPTLFMGAITQAAYTYTPQLTSYTFENLRATGDIRLIRNQALTDGLFEYYGYDAAQRQFRPLEFATEHRHFELSAGILSLEQSRYMQEHWLMLDPANVDAARGDQPPVSGILEAAERLQHRPELVAWLPYVRDLQLEQIDAHGSRLERARKLLGMLHDYAAGIGTSD
jgi:hypothetical protein